MDDLTAAAIVALAGVDCTKYSLRVLTVKVRDLVHHGGVLVPQGPLTRQLPDCATRQPTWHCCQDSPPICCSRSEVARISPKEFQ